MRSQNVIELPVPVARLVLKDLIEKDYLKDQVVNLELQINTQNEIIQNKESESENLNGQIEAFESLSESKEIRIKALEKEIRQRKTSNTLWKITTVLGVLFSGYLVVK